jgi:glycosyltransferase involved in cell wall biosynthesis
MKPSLVDRLDVTFYMPSATPLIVPSDGPPAGGAEGEVIRLARRFVERGLRVGLVVFEANEPLPEAWFGIRVFGQPPVKSTVPLVRTGEYYLRIAASLMRARATVFVQMAIGPHTGLVAITARILRRRFVYSSQNVIDFDFGRLERRRWNVWLFNLGVRLADQVVVQTPEQVQLCRRRFGREPVLIKNVTERATRRHGVPEAFLWIGRLAHYKRPLAYAELARSMPQARFWMVGVPSGPDARVIAAELERASAELPNLELLAPRPPAELSPLLDRAVALINTSDYEGMPNVLLEGWARGVPALALRHDPDGVIERERLGGYAAGSHRRLVELTTVMWEQRGDQAELADRCQRYIEREHAPEVVTTLWVNTLASL